MRLDDHDAVAFRLAEIALEAGQLLCRMQASTGEARIKGDGSPTTAADAAAEELILSRLAQTWPGVPSVAEESANHAAPGEHFFLVDPLDGTKDFLHGTGEYTRQCRPRRRQPAGGRRRCGAFRRTHLVRRARGPGRRDRARRRCCVAGPQGAAGAAERPRRPCQPPARRRRHRRLSRHALDRDPPNRLLGPEILPDRQRRSRHLRALRTDHGMGHGRRRPYPVAGGRRSSSAPAAARSSTDASRRATRTAPSRPSATRRSPAA